MTVGEIVKSLVTAEDYIEARSKVSDEFIDMVRCILTTDYTYIAEKEAAYQELLRLLEKD